MDNLNCLLQAVPDEGSSKLANQLREKELKELRASVGEGIPTDVDLPLLITSTHDLITTTKTLWGRCQDASHDVYFSESNGSACVHHFCYVSAKIIDQTLTSYVQLKEVDIGKMPPALQETLDFFAGKPEILSSQLKEREVVFGEVRRLPNYEKVFQAIMAMRDEFQAIYLQLLKDHVGDMKSLLEEVLELVGQLDESFEFLKEFINKDIPHPTEIEENMSVELGVFDAYGAGFNQRWSLSDRKEWKKLLKFYQFIKFGAETEDEDLPDLNLG